jgi:hypothetical protein
MNRAAILDRPNLQFFSSIDELLAFKVTGCVLEHGEGFVYAHDHGLARSAVEPLHFDLNIAVCHAFRRDTLRQAGIFPQVGVILLT